MQEGIKGIAFDLDGTLYPNYRLNVRLIPFIFKEWRLLSAFGKARNIIREEQKKNMPCRDCFYEHQAEIVAEILKVPAGPLKNKIDSLIYKGWEPLFKKIKLHKYVIETLEELKKAGYKLGLLSDFPPEVKLEYLNISGFWDAVLCSEHSGALKPHPLSFSEMADAMNLQAENIMYVGNSHPYDIAGAAGAGMKTAWIKNRLVSGKKKEPKPDFSFHNYRHLYDFMLK
ncbi:MAG: HAD family hydrolase [Treponema sp.]|nr:HAD family hydrolase [Treponema sp.]